MKNLKSFIAYIVTVVFMFSLIPTCALAEENTAIFADVNDSTMYKNAIEELYTKKIIDGYLDENGVRTFKPEATITRGEFSKLLAVALPSKIVLNMNTTSSGFSDVDSDPSVAWTIPYIKAAANASVVNGYEDGTFRANNPVSYAEAVKMIVCAMGYAAVIPVTDPWYDGYITVADQLKIRIGGEGTGDHNAAAPRGLVAQLIGNMTNSDKIEENGYVPGIEVEGAEKEELPEASGMVTAVFDKGLTNTPTNLSKTEMVIGGITYDFKDFKTYTEMMQYLGYRVDVTYESKGSKKSIKSIEKYDANDLKVTSSQLVDVNSGTFKYEEGTSEKKIKYNTSTYTFFNGTATGTISLSEMTTLLTITNGYVEFIDNDINGVADVAYIYNYDTYLVGTFDGSTNTITDKYNGATVTLGYAGQEESDENTVYKLCNSSGNLVDAYFSNISKNAVVSVAVPYNNDPNGATEVIICKTTVKDNVTAIGTDYVKIGSKKYETTSYYNAIVALNSANAITTGTNTLYLDFNGKVVAAVSNVNKLYGYIVDVPNAGGTQEPEVRILTSGGIFKDFNLRENLTVNKVSVRQREVPALLKLSADAINEGAGGKIAAGLAVNAMYAQPVIYETNSSGQITSLTTVANGTENASDALEYSLGKTTGTEKLTYKTSGRAFNRSSTKVFSLTYDSASDYKANIFVVPIDRADEEDYVVYTSSNTFFVNGDTYNVDAFNVDPSSKLYGNIVVVYGVPQPKVTGATKAFIITNLNDSITYGGDDAQILKYKEIGVANPQEDEVYVTDLSLISGLSAGDIIKFVTKRNDDKVVSSIEKVVVGGVLYEALNDNPSQTVSTDFSFVEEHNNVSDYFKAYMGRVLSAGSDSLQLIPRIADMPAEDDPSYNTIISSAKDYNTSGTSTHVIVIDRAKISTKPDDAIKYYTYSSITLKSIEENSTGNEDLIYIQFVNNSTASAIVIYR